MKHIQIIAEAGVNHNGDLDQALRLIDVAANAGADSVKFQTFNSKSLVSESARKASYQIQNTGHNESQLSMLQSLELSREQHLKLIRHCESHGIEFLSTPFDDDSVHLLTELGVQKLKVPSGEITNIPYLRIIGKQDKPVYLSTGMSTLGEVEKAINTLTDSGLARDRITVLHCSTEYPTPMVDVNLLAMRTLAEALKIEVGYSDHTLGIEVAIGAAALGATVIEKHFTIDRSLPGPDHAASLEPNELSQMVTAIRNIERAMGTGIKEPSSSEKPNKDVVRKSIVASRQIRLGEKFTADNLTAKRPGTGICVSLWDMVIGGTAQRDFNPEDQIEYL